MHYCKQNYFRKLKLFLNANASLNKNGNEN